MEQQDIRPHVLVIDSFALLFRGFYALAASGNYMRNTQGICVNGMYQFARYMLDAVRKLKPTHVVCAFDTGATTFRSEMFPAYKAQRGAPPPELVPQFHMLGELVEAFGIPYIGCDGFEADDVIGSMASRFAAEGAKISILTGDGDALQLIGQATQVVLFKKGFGNYEFVNELTLPTLKGIQKPYHVVEIKGLMGDVSDNIPGCPQIGPKTALKLIDEFDTVAQLYDNIGEVKGKLRERLLEHQEQVLLSRDLARIRTTVEFDCPLERCLWQVNREKLSFKLEELELGTLLRQFAAS